MAAKRTRVVLSVPWNDEDQEHPAQWDWDYLTSTAPDDNLVGVVLIDFAEVETDGLDA